MRSLIIGVLVLFLSGCTAMMLGGDVQPAEQKDTTESDEDSRRKK